MHSVKIKTLFIINPILEKKSGMNISRLISEHLDSGRFESTILYSEYPGHTSELASRNVGQYQLIVAGGGDGTVNQAARSLIHSDTALGILPLGSGKGLARSLGIPLNIRKAIRIINGFQTVCIDTGTVGGLSFVNIAGIGFAAEVAHAYADSKTRGFFPYAMNVVKRLPGYAKVNARIMLQNRDIRGEYFDLSFANSTQWGYGAHVSPTSNPGDGFLEVCILRTFPRMLLPGLLARLFTKTIHRSKYMEVIPVQKALISGDGPFKGHIDGEPVEFNPPFEVSIEPGSLKVVCAEKH